MASVLGLSALLNMSAHVFSLVKWTGALYLLYLQDCGTATTALTSELSTPYVAPGGQLSASIRTEIPWTKNTTELAMGTMKMQSRNVRGYKSRAIVLSAKFPNSRAVYVTNTNHLGLEIGDEKLYTVQRAHGSHSLGIALFNGEFRTR
jgi:hypothetical protein